MDCINNALSFIFQGIYLLDPNLLPSKLGPSSFPFSIVFNENQLRRNASPNPCKETKKPKKQKKAILIRMLTCKIEHVKPKSTKEHSSVIISSLKDDYIIINVNGYNFNSLLLFVSKLVTKMEINSRFPSQRKCI